MQTIDFFHCPQLVLFTFYLSLLNCCPDFVPDFFLKMSSSNFVSCHSLGVQILSPAPLEVPLLHEGWVGGCISSLVHMHIHKHYGTDKLHQNLLLTEL